MKDYFPAKQVFFIINFNGKINFQTKKMNTFLEFPLKL
jgi:hypothetical protein